MAGPEFPVNLGNEPLQTTPEWEADQAYTLSETHRGFPPGKPVRNTPRQQPIPHPETYGRYED